MFLNVFSNFLKAAGVRHIGYIAYCRATPHQNNCFDVASLGAKTSVRFGGDSFKGLRSAQDAAHCCIVLFAPAV